MGMGGAQAARSRRTRIEKSAVFDMHHIQGMPHPPGCEMAFEKGEVGGDKVWHYALKGYCRALF